MSDDFAVVREALHTADGRLGLLVYRAEGIAWGSSALGDRLEYQDAITFCRSALAALDRIEAERKAMLDVIEAAEDAEERAAGYAPVRLRTTDTIIANKQAARDAENIRLRAEVEALREAGEGLAERGHVLWQIHYGPDAFKERIAWREAEDRWREVAG